MMQFPRYNELTDAQKDAVDVPLDHHALVVGAPGTGKSAIVLHRAAQAKGKRVAVWTYNHMLAGYLRRRQAELEQQVQADTFYTWFWSWWKSRFTVAPPLLRRRERERWSQPDFEACERHLDALPRRDRDFDIAFVDEGQDLPPAAFRILAKYVACSLTVTADTNQSISNAGSTLAELMTVLDEPDPIELTKNFRCPARIQLLADHYHTDPAIVRPTNASGQSGHKPIVVDSVPYTQAAQALSRIISQAPKGRHIGVVVCGRVPVDEPMHGRVTDLRAVIQRLNLGVSVEAYVSLGTASSKRTSADRIDLSEPGVTVLTQWSTKGLEFDWVIAVSWDLLLKSAVSTKDGDVARRLVYVLVSRTRERLVLMSEATVDTLAADADLPDNDVYDTISWR